MAEDTVRLRRLGPKVKVRVDLHGVSLTGPGDSRNFVRWEWMEEITAGDGVVVRSDRGELRIPSGAFGLRAPDLAQRLRAAREIDRRTDVIGGLVADEAPPD